MGAALSAPLSGQRSACSRHLDVVSRHPPSAKTVMISGRQPEEGPGEGAASQWNRSVEPVVCVHVERTPRRRPVSSAAPQPDIARTGHPHGQPAHHAHVASKKRRAVGALSFLPTEQVAGARAGANTRHSGQRPGKVARTAETDVKGDASMPHPILRAERIPTCRENPSDHAVDAARSAFPSAHPPKQTGHHQ